uniref:NADH-ubiquinone oxidoreductase chain 2 n=2 Tax=unclassified Coloceras TaxID=2629741 RepID=G1EN72_9NEOP|nr:NADH dehydrogenase subunit 2 [Coloceras sp. SLC-2005]AEM23845.1 NADH dehydrogenase subunit 2 [Coloceras sp. SLC-2011]AEM23850.1 NADH dehydrogenase subunit 2 [Coloceras sp. SLC-2011]
MGNLIFLFMLLLSVLITFSSSSWLVCWMMMEVSSFFFVPMLFGFWSLGSVVSSLKYFVVQSIGSSIFFFSVFFDSVGFMGWEWAMSSKDMGVLTCLSMMIKLGVFPFSGWMIHISENLSWSKFFLLSSIQEVIPLLMISKFWGSSSMIFFFLVMGVSVLMTFCFSSYSIHWIMMVSSLFNVGWMVVASLLSKGSLVFFMTIYFSTMFVFFWILEEVVSIGSMSAMSSFSILKGGKIVFLFVVFMMMGVPPLGNFLGKVEIVSSMIFGGFLWLSFFFLTVSSIFMFLYLKISLCISMEMKGGKTNFNISYFKVIVLMFMSIFFLIWMF